MSIVELLAKRPQKCRQPFGRCPWPQAEIALKAAHIHARRPLCGGRLIESYLAPQFLLEQIDKIAIVEEYAARDVVGLLFTVKGDRIQCTDDVIDMDVIAAGFCAGIDRAAAGFKRALNNVAEEIVSVESVIVNVGDPSHHSGASGMMSERFAQGFRQVVNMARDQGIKRQFPSLGSVAIQSII